MGTNVEAQIGDRQDAGCSGPASGPAAVDVEELCQGTWRVRAGVVFRPEEGGGILFDPDTDGALVINQTGAALLRCSDLTVSFAKWRDALCSHYKDLKQETVESDLKKYLGTLHPFLEFDHD